MNAHRPHGAPMAGTTAVWHGADRGLAGLPVPRQGRANDGSGRGHGDSMAGPMMGGGAGVMARARTDPSLAGPRCFTTALGGRTKSSSDASRGTRSMDLTSRPADRARRRRRRSQQGRGQAWRRLTTSPKPSSCSTARGGRSEWPGWRPRPGGSCGSSPFAMARTSYGPRGDRGRGAAQSSRPGRSAWRAAGGSTGPG